MCGIAGTLDFAGRPLDADILSRACATMRHRGPDDQGVFVDARAGLACGLASVRLAVVDPTPAGHQPFLYHNDRYVLSYNGEIYNHRALRRDLSSAGWEFHTDTDTEVVAAACAAWGADALPRFNGMFALAFFDRRERRGFLARDRYGIKPLLIARDDRRLHFASEMTTLRGLGDWDRRVDEAALLHYLRLGYFAAPQTVYAQAERLPPGSYLAFDRNGPQPSKHYPPNPRRDAPADYSEACGQVRAAMFQAVARRRLADVPLGAFLSGGVDSAVIALHLAECTPGPIKTFSIGYREHGQYDETPFARRLAADLGADHHELHITTDDVLATLVPMLDHLGEPFFDSSILPTAIVARLARQHVTVCLSGDGGDELFGGYWRYLGHDTLDGYRRWPAGLRRGLIEPLLRRLGSSKSSPLANRVRQFQKLLRAGVDAPPLARHLAWSKIVSDEAEQILVDPQRWPAIDAEIIAAAQSLTDHLPDADPLQRILAFDLRYGLPSDMLHKVDLASMYHALEVRVPFLDPDVVTLVESCPAHWKVRRGLRKRLLIDAYRGRLPDEILDRPKMGFEVPIGEFFRSQWRDLFRDTVTRERVQGFGILDYAGIERVFADHCARRGEHADLLFALLSLCWWRMRGG